jgi:DNA-binding transcriptional regulator LsrR (DeoR family)
MRAGLTTKLTPAAVTTMPASVTKVMGSLNKTQAITAVVGGTKYNKLVTDAAAPR